MGNGSHISFWYDSWTSEGPHSDLFSEEEIERSRIPWDAKVVDVFASESWRFYFGGAARR